METQINSSEYLVSSPRQMETDKQFKENISNQSFTTILFQRLVAKEIKFIKVNFSYCTFDSAYLRKCSFDSCDFTGCKFINSNLGGSSFSGCKFNYATFEKTTVDNDILKLSCPSEENLKQKFARNLRINFQQLGDAKSANLAILIELAATREHLYKAWSSNESYYRKKYTGIGQIKAFIEWLEFIILDFIWGNGEKPIKLIRTILLALLVISIYDFSHFSLTCDINSFKNAIYNSPQLFFGVRTEKAYPGMFISIITLVRLVLFGFFMSIIIKRFNRR